MKKHFVITIASGYGSGGRHIAKRVAEDFHIDYLDQAILTMTSELSGINERFFVEANERINKGKIAIYSSKGVYTGIKYGINDKKYTSDENLFNYQAEVIKNVAISGKSCVIIGKAANFILRSLKNVISFNIQASEETAVRNIVKRQVVSEEEARLKIRTTDAYRSNYYKYYTGENWYSPKAYDFSINTDHISESFAVDIIENIIRGIGFVS